MTLGRRLPSSCADPMGEWREERLIKSQRQGTLLTFSSPARGFDTPFLSLTWPRPKEGKKGQNLGQNEHQRSFYLAYIFMSQQSQLSNDNSYITERGDSQIGGFKL